MSWGERIRDMVIVLAVAVILAVVLGQFVSSAIAGLM